MQHYYLNFDSSTNNEGSKPIQMSRSHMQKSLLWDWRLETEGNQIEKNESQSEAFFSRWLQIFNLQSSKGGFHFAIISGSSLDYDICARGVVEVGPRRAHPNFGTTLSAQKALKGSRRRKASYWEDIDLPCQEWFSLPSWDPQLPIYDCLLPPRYVPFQCVYVTWVEHSFHWK